MTTKIIAYRERNWFDYEGSEKRTDFRLWDHLCRSYDCDLQLIDDWSEAKPVGSIVLLEEQGSVLLDDFIHPAEVTYVFGRTSMNGMEFVPHDHKIRIETGNISLFGVSAGSIVLYDRYIKCR